MRSFTAVIERCPDTALFVGYVPGFPGAHSQGETLDELQQNLAEVIELESLPDGIRRNAVCIGRSMETRASEWGISRRPLLARRSIASVGKGRHEG